MKLRKIGADFSADHPILAPLLAETGTDPDVQRLLEGVAFLSAHVQQRLDDEFPELVHTLLESISPDALRPLPSMTIMSFRPKSNLSDTFVVPKGTYIDSSPVDGTTCRFQTCYDIPVHLLELSSVHVQEEAIFEESHAELLAITLELNLTTQTLEDWSADHLRFYLAGSYANSCDLFFLLQHYLRHVEIQAGTTKTHLPPSSLTSEGFATEQSLLPIVPTEFPSYRILKEFFAFPEKFLFLNLDLKDWIDRGQGNTFSLTFYCSPPPFSLPEIAKENFDLYAVPAVNLFPQDADPIILNQKQSEVLVRPSETRKNDQIFSIDSVSGMKRGEATKREYTSFQQFQFARKDKPVYKVVYKQSTQNHIDQYLQIAYPPEEIIQNSEILSIELTCSNGVTPESLRVGDLSKPTSNTPEVLTYRNITIPSIAHAPQLQGDLLWKLIANFSASSTTLTDLNNFKSILSKYVVNSGRDKPKEIANQKRIQGITAIEATSEERIFERSVYRGQAIHLKINSDQYVSRGDMYLFGVVLNYFFGTYSSFNTYTTLSLEDIIQWEILQWPARMGTRPLI